MSGNPASLIRLAGFLFVIVVKWVISKRDISCDISPTKLKRNAVSVECPTRESYRQIEIEKLYRTALDQAHAIYLEPLLLMWTLLDGDALVRAFRL